MKLMLKLVLSLFFKFRYADLITSEGTILILNPQTAGLQCLSADGYFKLSFVDCVDASVATFDKIYMQDGFFHIKLTNNAYTNEDLCLELNDELIMVINYCNQEKRRQSFWLDENGKGSLKNVNNGRLCITPWYGSLRNMPCIKLNDDYRFKMYNFKHNNEALAVQRKFRKKYAPSRIEEIKQDIENLKRLRHGYGVFMRRSATFSDHDHDFSGLYRWNADTKMFQHFLDDRKVFRLNNETKLFEITILGGHPWEPLSEHAKSTPTKLSKYYFERYEIVELQMFDSSFCEAFDPCQNGGQCHNKPMGFTCSCNPLGLHFGPLCDSPTPCKLGKCKNHAECLDIFHTNGTVSFSCDCSNSPEGFSGLTCNECNGGQGRGIDGVCVSQNACFDIVKGCTSCDNENDPRVCKSCQDYHYFDATAGKCKENQCICINGVIDDICRIHNRFNCKSCDRGYVHRMIGDNRQCDACENNYEPNDRQTQCIPCLANYENLVVGGLCQLCPDHHVRAVDEDACRICANHTHRPIVGGTCELCPDSTPRRLPEDPNCLEVNCQLGHYANVTTNWLCQDCGLNNESSEDRRSCLHCPSHYFRQLHHDSCQPCPPHWHRTTSEGVCEICPYHNPIRFSDETACRAIDCPLYQYANLATGWQRLPYKSRSSC